MIISSLSKETLLINNILKNVDNILFNLKTDIIWDDSIKSRKTASFGKPYNYSNIVYKKTAMPQFLNELISTVYKFNDFLPNNCLINYYYENSSKMGYHSDDIDILEGTTGIVIFSFGSKRILRFKSKIDNNIIHDFCLDNNSYFYMSQEVQKYWLHSVLQDKSNVNNERFSITFRKIIK